MACRCPDAACRRSACAFSRSPLAGAGVCVCVLVLALLCLLAFVATFARPLLRPLNTSRTCAWP
eukprot:4247316-Alexandrium_andersonii.AAC.1